MGTQKRKRKMSSVEESKAEESEAETSELLLWPTLNDVVRLKKRDGDTAAPSGFVRYVGMRKGRVSIGVELRAAFRLEFGVTSGRIGGMTYFRAKDKRKVKVKREGQTEMVDAKPGLFVSDMRRLEMVQRTGESVKWRFGDRCLIESLGCKATVRAALYHSIEAPSKKRKLIYGVELDDPRTPESDFISEDPTRRSRLTKNGYLPGSSEIRLFECADHCGYFALSSEIKPMPNEELSLRNVILIISRWFRDLFENDDIDDHTSFVYILPVELEHMIAQNMPALHGDFIEVNPDSVNGILNGIRNIKVGRRFEFNQVQIKHSRICVGDLYDLGLNMNKEMRTIHIVCFQDFVFEHSIFELGRCIERDIYLCAADLTIHCFGDFIMDESHIDLWSNPSGKPRTYGTAMGGTAKIYCRNFTVISGLYGCSFRSGPNFVAMNEDRPGCKSKEGSMKVIYSDSVFDTHHLVGSVNITYEQKSWQRTFAR